MPQSRVLVALYETREAAQAARDTLAGHEGLGSVQLVAYGESGVGEEGLADEHQDGTSTVGSRIGDFVRSLFEGGRAHSDRVDTFARQVRAGRAALRVEVDAASDVAAVRTVLERYRPLHVDVDEGSHAGPAAGVSSVAERRSASPPAERS